MRHYYFAFAVLCCPWTLAAQTLGAPEAKRFFPLDAARGEAKNSAQGIALSKEEELFLLHSDSHVMGDGELRMDRAASVPVPAQHALPMTPQPAVAKEASAVEPGDNASDSEEIEGNREGVSPVLALFGASDGAGPRSFREAMGGAGGKNASGMLRHLRWPVPLNVRQTLSSGYGMRTDPFHGRPAFHGGIDIAAESGTPVLATADGQVVAVQTDPNYGKYITLAHADGTLTRYGHLSVQQVREDAHVQAGQVIGAVGATGRATGPHLDYRVSRNGMKFDPLTILAVPSNVAVKQGNVTNLAAASKPAMRRGHAVASNAIAKRAMVIQVR